MRLLPHITTSASATPPPTAAPTVPVAPAESDRELRLLKERVQALESQSKAVHASEPTDLTPLLAPLKADIETQAQTLATLQKTLATLEERLHSCEQAPRLFAMTFMKDVEERVHGGLAALEKKIAERFEKLPAIPKAMPVAPAPLPVEKPAVAVAMPVVTDWENRFENHEKALAGLMKEITEVAAPLAAPALIVPELPLALEIPKPFETTAPDRMADHSLDIEWTPGDSSHRPSRSLATRLWYYLNEPAFGTPAERADERPTDE